MMWQWLKAPEMNMNANLDFEDMLALLNKHEVRYLVVGGLAFIFHAKPRYTKDMDLWVEGSDANILLANNALVEFGCPNVLDYNNPKQVLQIGLPPNRIDILIDMESLSFDEAWAHRICAHYGSIKANWIDAESLFKIKNSIDAPRHQEDARVLLEILRLRRQDGKSGGVNN